MTNTRNDGLWLSPSSAGGCHRQRILQSAEPYYLELEKQWSPSVGNAIHEWIVDPSNDDHLHEVKLSMTLQVPIEPDNELVEVKLMGTADLYVKSKRRGYDWKTIKDFMRYDPSKKKRMPRKLPEPAHVLQTNLYRLLLESNGYPVDEFYIWYVRQGEPTRKMIQVELMDLDEVYNYAHELAVPLAHTIRFGTLPAPIWGDPGDLPWQCKYCSVQAACFRKAEEGQ